VLTEVCDPTADFVLEHLNQRGIGFWRLDPGDFPDAIDLSAGFDGSWFGELLGPLRLAELAEVRAVYSAGRQASRPPKACPSPKRISSARRPGTRCSASWPGCHA
jgi:hypothetical protein